MTDLYGELGIDRTADDKEIRKAYRRRAKAAHPDVGGAPEEFDRIATALMVLTDPKRRAQYDETGSFDELRPDNELADTINAIGESLGRVLDQARSGAPMLDFIRCMKNDLSVQINRWEGTRGEAERGIKEVEGFAKRFQKKTDGLNWLYQMARKPAEQLEAQIAQANKCIAAMERAVKFLDDYRDAEAIKAPMSPVGAGGLAEFALNLQRGRMW